MDQLTLEALKKSIGKWESIAAGIGIDAGTRNCALCRLFFLDCPSCVVAEATGKQWWCNGSPYRAFIDHHDDCHLDADYRYALCPECRRLAQAEVDFLKSLLPEESHAQI